MKPSEILEKAAAHMERVGLHKGEMFVDRDESGPCCVNGAIFAVCIGRASLRDIKASEILLRRSVGVPVSLPMAVPRWNDAPERTQVEVVAKLREAAELARAEGQ